MQKSSAVKICAFEGCGRNVKGHGLCNAHYQQKKAGLELRPVHGSRAVAKCEFDGCEREAICRKLCDGHYQQLRAGKELRPLQQIHETCTVPGCVNPHDAKGLCSAHYSQMKYRGEVRSLDYEPSPIAVGGCVTLYGIDAHGRHGKEVGHTWIDIEDASAVGAHRWRRNSNGYASTKIEGKPVLLHRLLLNPSEAMEIDHIDGDRLNNRRSNLRVVTHKQNMQNKPTSGATGHRGVFYEAAKGLYRVLVIKDGVRHSGGRHKNLEDAIAKATALRAELLTHHNEDRSARNDD